MSQGEVGDEVGEVGEASSLRQIIKCEAVRSGVRALFTVVSVAELGELSGP